MKQFIRILFSLIIFDISTSSQPEFKISIDHIKWENPSATNVDLTIFFIIKNVGNQKGWCEDLNGIYLECSDYYYYYGTHINLKDYSNNIVSEISPDKFIEVYMTYTLPKDADDITLRFTESRGGASKYITVSYNKWLINEKNAKFDMFVSEGDLRMTQNYPEEAVSQYNYALGLKVDVSKKEDVKKKLAEAYTKIGDKFYDNKIWNFAIENYKLSIENNYSFIIKEKIANIYKIMGDEKYSIGARNEALEYYDLSLRYKEDTKVRLRKKKIITEVIKKEKKEKKIRNKKKQYQQYLNPKVGFKLGGGISYQNKDGEKKSFPFWSANLNIIPKLYVGESSPFSAALNTEFSVSGLITGTSNKSFTEYYNFGDSIITSETALSNEYSFNTGLCLGFISNSVTPILLINYGVYALNLKYNVYSFNTNQSGDSSVDVLYWGYGPKIEFILEFGRAFFIGYSYKSYTISASLKNFDGAYTGHNVSLGLMFF